ncbi:hypothetical protein [Chromobacterium haemolyticum]|uniref:hypothetical protein n=1 Tax=Chromobacterium haemolyticum TaxID=394935 RepID=UPI001F08039D|nr:hypothetical protein [Chromobacterium haemolyticum]
MSHPHPDIPSQRLSLSLHEEQCWLLQQQHPERLSRHVDAWRLDPQTDLALLTLALQQLIQARPELNARYEFSETAICANPTWTAGTLASPSPV